MDHDPPRNASAVAPAATGGGVVAWCPRPARPPGARPWPTTCPRTCCPAPEPLQPTPARAGVARPAHGFTGDPVVDAGSPARSSAAGFSIELPLLPGHGTVVEDLIPTTFTDWLDEAEAAYQRLAARCEQVLIVGLSMGGGLTVWLGGEHPEVVGLVCINAIVSEPEGMRAFLEELLASGTEILPGIASDIAKEGVEIERTPNDAGAAAGRSMLGAGADLDGRLRSHHRRRAAGRSVRPAGPRRAPGELRPARGDRRRTRRALGGHRQLPRRDARTRQRRIEAAVVGVRPQGHDRPSCGSPPMDGGSGRDGFGRARAARP